VLCIFRIFVGVICKVWNVDFTPGVPSDVSADQLNGVLATFHTAFNICNTCILIGFIPVLEKLVCKLLPSKKGDSEEEGKLKFITGGLMSTSELSILQAWKEIHLFGVRTQRMIGMVGDLYHETDEAEFNKIFSRIEKYEGISDRMEVEIASYLNQVADGRLSEQSKHEVHKMLRICSEIESVGDANYNLARYMKHRFVGKFPFTEYQNKNIEEMHMLLVQANSLMVRYLEEANITEDEFMVAVNLENEINNFRSQLKEQNTINVTEHQYEYLTGVNYMDIVNEFEKMGDYIINVDEAISGRKVDK